jgi:hypothetical protein
MAINLKTIKRGSNHLKDEEKLTIIKSKPSKKIGRKKIDESEKASEKVITYITKDEKEKLDDLCRNSGMKLSQYFRTLILSNIK